jgi:hypothetical protein
MIDRCTCSQLGAIESIHYTFLQVKLPVGCSKLYLCACIRLGAIESMH